MSEAISADVPAAQLVFVDESGTTTRMTPSDAVAPKGKRAYGSVPRNQRRNTTLVAAPIPHPTLLPLLIHAIALARPHRCLPFPRPVA